MFNIKLTFELENTLLPKDMERLVVSFLKAAIEKEDKELFEKLFNKLENRTKSYCFSLYLPGARFRKDGIALGKNCFNVIFSDADAEQLLAFYNAFIGMKFKSYPIRGNGMKLTYVTIIRMKEIEESEIIIKMLSPLMVRQHDEGNNKDKYLIYSDEGFAENVKQNIIYQLKKMNVDLNVDSFSIEPIKCRKVVVPTFGKLQDATLGIFKLKGEAKLLNFLYNSGIGSRRSEGRGKWELIS